MDAMVEVFWKVRELSARHMTPRPKLMVQDIANELLHINEQVVPALDKLKTMRLVEFNKYKTPYVKLTLLGANVLK